MGAEGSDRRVFWPVVICVLSESCIIVDVNGMTAVFDDNPFPGGQNGYGDIFNEMNSILGLPIVPYPDYIRFFDDDSTVWVKLIRQSSEEFERYVLEAAKRICMSKKEWEYFYDPWFAEMLFDTKYQKNWDKYYLIEGDGKVWRGNEINYFGIGMMEASRGSGKGLSLVYSWKIAHGHWVSEGTKYWYNKGYGMYEEYSKRLDPCTCEEK